MTEFQIAARADSAAVTELVQAGIKADSSNFQLAVVGANRFLPKWGGNAAQFEAWARSIADAYPEPDRKAMYARIYWQGLLAQYQEMLFKHSLADWEYLMQGLRDLVALRSSEAHLNQALIMACLGGNRAFTKELLLHPNFNYAEKYWYQLKVVGGAYQPCRDWAAK